MLMRIKHHQIQLKCSHKLFSVQLFLFNIIITMLNYTNLQYFFVFFENYLKLPTIGCELL